MPRNYDSDDMDDNSDEDDDSSGYSDDEHSAGYSDDEGSYSHKNRYFGTIDTRKRTSKISSQQPKGKFQRTLQTPQTTLQSARGTAYQDSRQAGVYVLRNTQTNICYVGKSENVESRLLQHRADNNTVVLNLEKTITTGSVNDLESWERNEVLTRMYHQGMESVRGWKYTRKGPLTMEEKISVRNDIMEKFDLCRRCGHNNHFITKCFARSSATWCKHIPMQ
jgi:hypothetical protein